MPYVTGGWGYGQFSNSATITGIGSVSSSNSHSAWVIGGGAEWMWAPHWSARLEYLYLDTGNITNNWDSRTVECAAPAFSRGFCFSEVALALARRMG